MSRNTTIKESLLDMTGYILIEHGRVGIVWRNGCFSEFLEAGRYPPLNPWNERLIAQIPIKLLSTESEELEASSADGFTFNTKVSVWFTFDPSKAARKQRVTVAQLALAHKSDEKIKAQVLRDAKYGLRKVVGRYKAEDLMQGQTRSSLEREIRHHLQSVLTEFGILIRPSSGVLIEALTPPDVLTDVKQTFYQRQKAVELLEQHPQTALQVHLLETLGRGGNIMYLNGSMPNQLLGKLMESAFVESDSMSIGLEGHNVVHNNAYREINGRNKKGVNN